MTSKPKTANFKELTELEKKSLTESNNNKHNSNSMLSYILSGKNRIRIFCHLAKKPCYAYQLAKELNLNPTSTIQCIYGLKARNIITCLNPDSYRRKFYQITPEAAFLKEFIHQLQEEG